MALSGTATEESKQYTRVAAEDREAVERFIRDHYEGIHRLARHLTRNSDDAADLAQITFIKACAKLDRYDGRSSLRSWVTGILYHEFLHWRRAKRFFARIFDNQTYDPTGSILDREVLLRAIHSLPTKLRDTFLLVEVHEFTVSEASAILNVPIGTIKSRLSAARTKLRAQIHDGDEHEL